MSSLLCTIPILAGLMSACAPPPPLATGYVEGEYVLIAPVATAQITALSVRRGDRVEAGAPLAEMERRDAEIAVAQAEAALAEANSRRQNLSQGKREAEIAVIEATLASATAQATEAEKATSRIANLVERGVLPQSQLDDAVAERDVAQSRVVEARASLDVARLPARPHEIAAAEAAVKQAEANVAAAKWQRDQRSIAAPATGTVFEVLRRTGEIAGPQAPVISLLPDQAVLLRLYVPEAMVSQVAPGARLRVNCDGCTGEDTATVVYVSDAPEFTPPVIYSLENRQKLVYLVEARPDPGSATLKPGQIVDVDLAALPGNQP